MRYRFELACLIRHSLCSIADVVVGSQRLDAATGETTLRTADNRTLWEVRSQLAAISREKEASANAETDRAVAALASIGPPPPADLMSPPLSAPERTALKAAFEAFPNLFVAHHSGQRFLGPAVELCKSLFGKSITTSNALKRASDKAASPHAARLKWDSRTGQPAGDTDGNAHCVCSGAVEAADVRAGHQPNSG